MLNKEGEFKGPRGRSSSLIAVILLLMTSITFPDALSGRASSPLPAAISGSISHIWANTGEDKVTRDELRATSDPDAVFNSVWDGTTISLFGARNEVVAFNLIIEAPYSVAGRHRRGYVGQYHGLGQLVRPKDLCYSHRLLPLSHRRVRRLPSDGAVGPMDGQQSGSWKANDVPGHHSAPPCHGPCPSP